MFLVGVLVDYLRETNEESRMESSIPVLLEENRKFIQASAMLQADYDVEISVIELNEDGSLRSLSLNTAGVEGLVLLPGVGDVIAERIITMRDTLGAFKSVEDLLSVSGIGEKKLEQMVSYIIIE